MDCRIQTCHTQIASRFLRRFCSFSQERDLGNIVICKYIQQECRVCSVFEPCWRIKWQWCFPSVWRKGTWQEGQKPKGWLVVCLRTALSGCWNQINLWKAVKGFLGWTLLELNRKISLKSVSPSLCLEHSVIWTLSEQPVFILCLEPLTPLFFPLWAIYMPKSISGGLFTFSLMNSRNKAAFSRIYNPWALATKTWKIF